MKRSGLLTLDRETLGSLASKLVSRLGIGEIMIYGTGGSVDNGNPFTSDFDELTIGTAINADRNELLHSVAFKIGALEQEELLSVSKGVADTSVWGTGATMESQEAWGWSVGAGVELNLGIIDALAKFHIVQTNNACTKSSDVKVRGTSTYRDAYIELLNGEREQLLQCATPLFRGLVKKVYDAAKALESQPANEALSDVLIEALMEFYGKFGTGFVDRIELQAVGVFEGTLHSDSNYAQSNLDIGGDFSLNLPGFSAGLAAKFCSQKTNATAATQFLTRAYGRPPGCGPHDWAMKFHDAFVQNGIVDCADPEVWKVPFDNAPTAPAEPVIRSIPLDTVLNLPTIAKDLLADAVKAIQYRTLDEKYKTDEQGNLLDKDVALQNELATLATQAHTEKQINDKALLALTDPQISEQSVAAVASSPDVRSSPVSDAAPRLARFAARAEIAGDKSLGSGDWGGYAVTGYRYQPWSLILEELDIGKVRTRHQVVFLQSMLWYSIRGMFAQYLDYCANYPNIVGPTLNARGSADKFRSALETVGELIDDRLRDKAANNLTVIEDLERELQKRLGPQYSMRKQYEFWLKNYEWLKRIPFGVVAVVERDNKHWIQANPYPKCPYWDPQNPQKCKAFDTLEAETLLRENAYRLYPIISTNADGEPHFVWVGAPSRLTGDVEDHAGSSMVVNSPSGIFPRSGAICVRSWRLHSAARSGSRGHAPITMPRQRRPRRSIASTVSAVWLSVPRPARATTTSGASSRCATSAIVPPWSSSATSRPPAPSMITRSWSSWATKWATSAIRTVGSLARRAAVAGASGSG